MQYEQSPNWLPRISSNFRKVISLGSLKYKLLALFISIILYLLLAINSSAAAATTVVKVSAANPQSRVIFGGFGGNIVQTAVDINDVTDPDGLAGFSFTLRYDPDLIYIPDSDNDGVADDGVVTPGSKLSYLTSFLNSTGKQIECNNGFIEPDQAQPSKMNLTVLCASIGPSSSPTGSGRLVSIEFTTGSGPGRQTLEIISSQLADNSSSTNPIPHTTSNMNITIIKCADVNGDGYVSLLNDILGVINHYGLSDSSPDYDSKYDLNDDGFIDLINDILGTIFQYNTYCYQ